MRQSARQASRRGHSRALVKGSGFEVSIVSRSHGPDLVDGVLDLLLDGAQGVANFVPIESMSEAEFAHSLAFVADAEPSLIVATGAPASFEPLASTAASYSPPGETTLERFVRERRAERRSAAPEAVWREEEAMLVAAE